MPYGTHNSISKNTSVERMFWLSNNWYCGGGAGVLQCTAGQPLPRATLGQGEGGGQHGASPQEGHEDCCSPHTSPAVVVREVLGIEGPLAGWSPHTITCDRGTGGIEWWRAAGLAPQAGPAEVSPLPAWSHVGTSPSVAMAQLREEKEKLNTDNIHSVCMVASRVHILIKL